MKNNEQKNKWQQNDMDFELQKLLGFGNAKAIMEAHTREFPEDVFRCDAEFGSESPHQAIFKKLKK